MNPSNERFDNIMPNVPKGRVAIILGYWCGEKYIAQQLDSLESQTYPAFHVFIFDDASPHSKLEDVLTKSNLPRSKITRFQRNANLGFCRNFLDGLQEAKGDFEYFAFCDQDDIWEPQKLERALLVLLGSNQTHPTLYCSRTIAVDQDGQKRLGISPLFKKTPSFKNALLQNICSGNTIVMNQKARQIIIEASLDVDVVAHDWWAYITITGAGGTILFDNYPSVKYRQHQSNLIGSNNNLPARLRRLFALWQGQFFDWNETHVTALQRKASLLTTENKETLESFILLRRSSIFIRLALLLRVGLYRQTLAGNILWIFGNLLKKY